MGVEEHKPGKGHSKGGKWKRTAPDGWRTGWVRGRIETQQKIRTNYGNTEQVLLCFV